MIMVAIPTSRSILSLNFNILKMFIWAIFCIITSPISLTTIQYVFQDNLGNSDKFLSIGILLSTIFILIDLSGISPSFFRKMYIWAL